MQITVADLKAYLESHDDDAVVKLCTGSSNGLSEVHDFSHIATSTEEVHGKEIVIHALTD